MAQSTPRAQTDIAEDGWIDRWVPRPARPYLRLMRLDRPIGTWLLLLPCWWGISLARTGTWPDFWLILLFGIGAVIMRGAGCTFNDIVDRDFDGRVARTRTRPIPSGDVSVRRAVLFLGAQLVAGLIILLQLDGYAIGLGIASLVLVFTYPLMKRVTYWPQIFLGLAFNWGALMGWAAVQGGLGAAPVVLYVAGIFWTLGYDTIYAHQDKDDDALIGVKSTALKLGAATRPWLFGFYIAAAALIAAAAVLAGLGWAFWPLWLAAALHMMRQAASVDIDDPAVCLATFRSNRDAGLIVLAAIIAGQLTM
ncbi:MAG: 4-hydroxybenzoate octaprenyltransferase [Alphaproteobacteria bacterium]|nr:4-hydroxybenzoate octaprenyltransferase [Alphaproteobacteria bacterium]